MKTTTPSFRVIRATTRKIHAILASEDDYSPGVRQTQSVTVEVATSANREAWVDALVAEAQRMLQARLADSGLLIFRLDGTDKLLTRIEKVQDWWFSLTGRGTQIRDTRFVPTFPVRPSR